MAMSEMKGQVKSYLYPAKEGQAILTSWLPFCSAATQKKGKRSIGSFKLC